MILNSNFISIDDLNRVIFDHEPIQLAEESIKKIDTCADYIRQVAESGKVVYGINTGFGANRDTIIQKEDAELLQKNLIMSHACGVGKPLPPDVSRAMLLLRLVALSKGFSGIRFETLNYLISFINHGISPVVPMYGSVGASGDLCPLAHMCLPLLGLGEAWYKGEIISGAKALEIIGLGPVHLTYKEGLALLNGTQAMTAVGLCAMKKVENLLDTADICGALSLEAVAGRIDAFDPRIQQLRRRPGQIKSAENVRQLVQNSHLVGCSPGTVVGKTEFVQDSYCFRCIPQVHGASRDVLTYFKSQIEAEANAVTDNPIVFSADVEGSFDTESESHVVSGGNFHGQPIAMALDYLKIAVSELGAISERRSALLTDKRHSEGLPTFLVEKPGLNSGLMVAQYVAAALASDNKTHAHPNSVDSIPTSANTEDHVSMGMNAAIHLLAIIENVTNILAIELLIASQAVDLRHPHTPGTGTSKVLKTLRNHVDFIHEDRVLSPDIKTIADLIKNEKIVTSVDEFLN